MKKQIRIYKCTKCLATWGGERDVCPQCGNDLYIEDITPSRLQQLQNDAVKWSDSEFGEDRTSLPIAKKLREETKEVIEAIELKTGKIKGEVADCLLLILDICDKENIPLDDLIEAGFEKLEINKTREWLPPDENGVIQHKR